MALGDQSSSVRPSSIPWPPILLALVIAGAIAVQRNLPIDWPGIDDTPARIVGLGIGAMGAGLTAWAVFTLVRHNTTVMPHHGVSALVTSGPFAWRRNPIYLGEIMMLMGLAELTKNVWFAAFALVFAALVTWLAILPEERHLEAKFGDAWRTYADRTRRLL
jgi:protein-S-isoprenylcysteine O-methyltransferase Ste14